MTKGQFRRAILDLGMNQAQAAEYLRVTEGAVSRWVNGLRPIPGPVAKLIERALAEGGR